MRRTFDDLPTDDLHFDDRPPDAKDEAELAELTARFAHRVPFFTRRVEGRFGLAYVWRDDLESAGYWGLFKALDNRRADAHEYELSAYVSRRIEGSILDAARQILGRLAGQTDCDPMDLEDASLVEGRGPDRAGAALYPDPEETLDRAFRWRLVERALHDLEASQRSLLLAFAGGDSLAEIARGEGVTPGRLQSEIRRGTRQIRARAPELRRILRHEL